MKKFLFILLVVLVVGSVAFAGRGNMSSSGCRWESSQSGRGYGRSVAAEEQEQYGRGQGYGYQNQEQTCDEFVDEDGDGVCDNCDGEGLAPQDGSGNQYGRNGMDRSVRGRSTGNQGKGAYCDEFVDEDGDGVCDNCDGEGLAPQDGSGNQYGRNMSDHFSGKGGRGNSRNGRK
jgi:hypothetical protein